jgi:GT2 family glycosyltransferase
VKASVIVTTYNRPDALVKVLNGLALQTHPAGEVLVADDGSSDATRSSIEQIKPSLPYPLVHVWHTDEGFRAAKIRNDAIRRSTGDYVVLLDGDCIPNRYFVSDHVRLAQTGCFFQGKRVLVEKTVADGFDWPQANSLVALFRIMLAGGLSNAHHVIRCPCMPSMPSPGISGTRSCNMGIFKADLIAVNGFNQDFFGWGREDSELAVRLTNYGLKRRTHPFMAICYHLWHAESDRARLKDNDAMLKAALASGTSYCLNGLVKKNQDGRAPAA